MTKQLPDHALLVISIIIFFNLIFNNIGLLIMYFIITLLFFAELSKRKRYLRLSYDVKAIVTFFLFWVIYSLIQLNFTVGFTEGLDAFLLLLNGVVLIFAMSIIINSKERLKAFYIIWGVSLLLIIIAGWFELLTGINIGNTGSRFQDIVTVNYFNPNNYSFVLTVSLPIVLYWIRDINLINKTLGVFMYISSLYFVYVNQTRLSLLLFIFVTVVFLAVLLRKKKRTFIFYSILILLVFLLNLGSIAEAIERLKTLDSSDGSLNKRNLLTDWALQIPFKYPFGVGPGQAEYYMPIVGSKLHNFWLEILANFGIVVFLGLIIFFIYFFYKVIIIENSNDLKLLTMPMFWVVLLFIPASNGPSSIFAFGILWFIFAVMLSIINIINKSASK